MFYSIRSSFGRNAGKRYWVVLLLLYAGLSVIAQTDSLILSNGDQLVGEIKSMDQGVMIIETPYSKNDFTVEWKKIREIYTSTRFLITLEDGRWYTSNLASGDENELIILGDNGEAIEIQLLEVVFLKELETDFWSRVNISVDVGADLTKANNLKQLNIQTSASYLTDNWGLSLYYNDYRSRQDSIAQSIRKEGGATYRYILEQDWYIIPQVNYLSNSEQALEGRISASLGAGRFLVRNNIFYWGIIAGLSFNSETFSNETEPRQSAELYGGTEVKLFDFGDLDLLSNLILYPSLTEKGRFRTDYKFDTKYEFAEDFYIKLNLTFNYDNQPAIPGNEIDYVFGISFGWEKEN